MDGRRAHDQLRGVFNFALTGHTRERVAPSGASSCRFPTSTLLLPNRVPQTSATPQSSGRAGGPLQTFSQPQRLWRTTTRARACRKDRSQLDLDFTVARTCPREEIEHNLLIDARVSPEDEPTLKISIGRQHTQNIVSRARQPKNARKIAPRQSLLWLL